MNCITNKQALEKVALQVERYCKDKGIKEVEAANIYDSKPDVKYIFSIPFNLNYERHYGPV